MKRFVSQVVIFMSLGLFASLSVAEEGMYPLSEIHGLNLEGKGLEIAPLDVYNPDGISIVDGICKLGGCSASFVSEKGLMLTNHHCAYDAIQRASTLEHNYLRDGFLANNLTEEIPAKGFTVRITESYQDVSNRVLSILNDDMGLAERTRAIEKKMNEIADKAELENPGKRAEVAVMFIGKTYVLFIYTYLRDVRLVYAPPQSIGNFGAEEDNWEWPRHTGDFSFMRAYVAPDGSPADYSVDNVPYTPRKVIKVAPEGVNEEDFVFILGYPGKTYRHHTSAFYGYEEEINMPYVVDHYGWQINTLEKLGKSDRAVALKLASRLKSLSNTYKKYKGRLKGMRRLNFTDKKEKEDQALQQYIDSDPNRKEKYGTVLSDIGEIFQAKREEADYQLLLFYLKRSCLALDAASKAYEASIERLKPDAERKSGFTNRDFPRTQSRLINNLKNYYEPADRLLFKDMLMKAAGLSEGYALPAFDKITGNENDEKAIDSFLDELYADTRMGDADYVMALFEKSTEEIEAIDDPFIRLTIALYPTYQDYDEKSKAQYGAIDKLYAKLVDVKKEYLSTDFVPDANGTLRMTFGHIRGYSPVDAVYSRPITTVKGVLEKTTGVKPFNTPQKLIDLIHDRDFGRFEHPGLGSVPVGILYDMDTTGGNSGSAVLNARGELVGINFDRAFEATINDYVWSKDLSRSIAVDIRYVLWVTQKYGGAGYLLEEMGVTN